MGKVVFDISMSLDGFMTAATSARRSRWARGASGCTSGPSATTRATARCSPRERAAWAR
jgi:hypothetical protein